MNSSLENYNDNMGAHEERQEWVQIAMEVPVTFEVGVTEDVVNYV